MSILLSNFATQRRIVISTANCGGDGGAVLLCLGTAEILPLRADAFDVVPYAVDGTQLVFTRLSYETSPVSFCRMAVTLPAAATGLATNYTIIIGSGYVSATDQSVAKGKIGPTGLTALAWWKLDDASTSSSPDTTANANALTLNSTPTRGGATNIHAGGNSLIALGANDCETNGSSQTMISSATLASGYSTLSINRLKTVCVDFVLPSISGVDPAYICCAGLGSFLGNYIGYRSGHTLQTGVGAAGGTTLLAGVEYHAMFVQSSYGTTLYLNGGVEVTTNTQPNPFWNGSGGGDLKIAFGASFRTNGNTPDAATFIPVKYGNIFVDSACWAAEEVLAEYNGFANPIALSPRRKLSLCKNGGIYPDTQFFINPSSGFGSGTGANKGLQEPKIRYRAGGWPIASAGNPKWICLTTDSNLGATAIGLWYCPKALDPTVGSNWILSGKIVGQGSGGVAGFAALNDIYFEESTSTAYISYATTFGSGGQIKCVTTTDFVTFASPAVWLDATTMGSLVGAYGTGYASINNHAVIKLTNGSYVMFVEVAGGATLSGSFAIAAWTSADLITWTYSQTISVAIQTLVNNCNSVHAVIQSGTVYLFFRSSAFCVATASEADLTTWTMQIEPLIQPDLAVYLPNNLDDPRGDQGTMPDGSAVSILLFGLGGNNGGGTATIGGKYYKGTFAQLFTTGTITIKTPVAPLAANVQSPAAGGPASFGPDANGVTVGTAAAGGGGGIFSSATSPAAG